MPTTTNFGWTTPADTDLVKDGALAIRTLGNGIDTSMVDLKGGTTGQVLSKASNTDMDFTWVAQDDSNAIQNAIVDAKGDLISATAADTPARLAVGTDGQVLTADSTTSTGLKWATAASGGMTVIQSGTLSGTSVVISSIVGTYKHLLLTIYGFGTSTGVNGDTPAIRINGQTGNNYMRMGRRSNGSTGGDIITTSSTLIEFGHSANYSKTDLDNHLACYFFDYANAANWPLGSFHYAFRGDDATINQASGVWAYNDLNAAITSVTILGSGGQTMNAGTYTLWGVS